MYQVTHHTAYRYNDPVSTGNHVACLRPRNLPYQAVRNFRLRIFPEPSSVAERSDYFGNTLHTFSIQDQHRELIVETCSEVEVEDREFATVSGDISWEEAIRRLPDDRTQTGLEAYQFCFPSPRIRPSPTFAEYAYESFTPQRPMREALMDLTGRICRDFKFQPNATNVGTTVEEVFEKRCGVCQDFAHLQIACLRSLHIPARYVSGYLRTIPPPGTPRLIGTDASHAWVSAYSAASGWHDFDPTNNMAADGDHITVAWGRDYGDVSPLRGSIVGGGVQALQVSVDVEIVNQAA
jgi:transglutaminase-like putative cysteine protease